MGYLENWWVYIESLHSSHQQTHSLSYSQFHLKRILRKDLSLNIFAFHTSSLAPSPDSKSKPQNGSPIRNKQPNLQEADTLSITSREIAIEFYYHSPLSPQPTMIAPTTAQNLGLIHVAERFPLLVQQFLLQHSPALDHRIQNPNTRPR